MIYYSGIKINIGLHVLRKRKDGFHDIRSIMYPLPFNDLIELNPGGGNNITYSGLPIPGAEADNLCKKALDLMLERNGKLQVNIHLHKRSPIGAGLGGGSSNGATVLKAINEVSDAPLSQENLLKIAADLGSDCPFFISGTPALAEGRGEILRPVNLDLSSYHIVLLNPGISINTGWAYGKVKPREDRENLSEHLQLPVEDWPTVFTNDFEEAVFRAYPEVGQLKNQLLNLGALYAAMSGSGSSVFGIFEKKVKLSSSILPFLVWEGAV